MRTTVCALFSAVLACGTGAAPGAGPGDGGANGDTTEERPSATDASHDDAADSADGAVVCSGSLVNPGFDLNNLPVARLCTQSWMGLRNVIESSPCHGVIMVAQETGGDCNAFWLFEAATGAVVASGVWCTGPLQCTGAAPGFRFPDQCWFDPDSGWQFTNICPDAGAEAGAAVEGGPDAPSD